MIPEQAREEVLRLRNLGQTWTSIAKMLLETYGVDVHRTTVRRWHDRGLLYSEGQDNGVTTDNERIRLDKRISTYKAEATHWKKLYEKTIQQTAKNELV